MACGQATGGRIIADAVNITRVGASMPKTAWTPSLPQRDEYEVYARWTANSFRSTAVPYTVFHEGGSTTVAKNQQVNGGTWQLLGTFTLAPGQSHRVEMTDATPDGTYIIADAVRFVPKANVAKTATWSFAVASTGSYKVYAKWPAASTHATDVPYSVTHAGGTSTVVANQRVNGGTWNLLGTYSFNAGTTYKVEVSDAVAAGKVAADAVYVAAAGAPSSDAFTWTPAFPSSGTYQVYARWPSSSANTGAAQYTVTHAGGTANVTLNQRQNGGAWVALGSWSFAPGAGHKVTLAASADGTTIADALLFVGAGAQPANLLYVHADHLGSPQKLTDASQATVWDGVFDPFGEEVTITGLAAMPLRFPGQYADDETGYSYNYFRDYDPTIGRYLQSDPLGLVAGLNTYAYAFDDPVNLTDPDGRNPIAACAWNPWCRGAAGGGLVAAADLLAQLMRNDWRGECVDWDRVGQQFMNGFALFAAGNPLGFLRSGARKLRDFAGDERGSVPPPKQGGQAAPTASATQEPSASSPTGQSGSPLVQPEFQPSRNSPGAVGGRQYSGHAFDQMQNRGMTPSVIENTITNGTARPGNTPGTTSTSFPWIESYQAARSSL